MKLNFNDYLRKCQFPLLLALGTIPIAPVFYAYSEVRFLPVAWALPVAYLVLSWIGLVISGKGRFVFGVLASGAFLLLGCLLMTQSFRFLLLTPALFYGALLLWTLRIAGWAWDEEMSAILFWLCLVVHVVAQFFLFTLQVRGDTYVDAAQTVILISFFAFVLLALLSMNRESMAVATAGRYRASPSMRRKNTELTLIFFGIALGIFMIPAVVSAIERLSLWAFETILKIVNGLLRLIPLERTEEGRGSISQMDSLPIGDKEPPLIFEIVEFILILLLCVLLISSAIALAVFLIRKGWQLLRVLWNNINRYASEVAEDYEDTITDTRDAGDKENILSALFGSRLPKVDERKLEPGARIRYRYLRLMLKHPEWGHGSTARENLSSDAASLYEQARYSAHPVSEEDAERFAGRSRRVH